jgi:hypothetical protein
MNDECSRLLEDQNFAKFWEFQIIYAKLQNSKNVIIVAEKKTHKICNFVN